MGNSWIRRYSTQVILITVFGLAVRLACLYSALPIQLTGDEVFYATTAYNITQGEGYIRTPEERAAWPPANSFLLSLFIRAGGTGGDRIDFDRILRSMLLGQVLLGAILVPLSMALSKRLLGKQTAIPTGMATALYPGFVAFSQYLWAENLFTVLTATGLVLVVETQRNPGLVKAAAAGLVFGVATLTRETGLVVGLACAAWWIWSAGPPRRRAVLRSAVMIGVALLTVLPWTLRNYRILGGFVPVSTVGWMAAAEGNIIDPEDRLHPNRNLLLQFRTARGEVQGELNQMEFSRRVALQLIREEQPAWFFEKLVRTSALMFSPDSFLFKKLSRGSYGRVPLGVIRPLLVTAVSAYLLILVAGILGVAAAPERRQRLLPCLVVGGVFLVHVFANASSRYRLPLMPLLIPYAAYALLRWREIPGRLAGRRWIAPAVIIAWLFVVCVPYFYGDAVSLWRQGTYINHWRP
jgi:4-amino-4-deoxy-L-arabinose transferase-like glycosyltransferase